MPRLRSRCRLLVTVIGAASRPRLRLVSALRPVAVQASASRGRVSGVVLDDAGAAVGGVEYPRHRGRRWLAARTDSRGRFALVLPVGEYLLRACARATCRRIASRFACEPKRAPPAAGFGCTRGVDSRRGRSGRAA